MWRHHHQRQHGIMVTKHENLAMAALVT